MVDAGLHKRVHLNEIFATILCSILLCHPRLPFLLGHFCIPSQLSGLCWSRRFQFIISVSCKQVLFVKQRLAPSIFCIILVSGHSQLTRIILHNDYYYAKDFLTIIITFWRLNREIKDRICCKHVCTVPYYIVGEAVWRFAPATAKLNPLRAYDDTVPNCQISWLSICTI